MKDHLESAHEPYEEMMERLSRGISTWNFNFGTSDDFNDSRPKAGGELLRWNGSLSPLASSRWIPLIPVVALVFLFVGAGLKGTLFSGLQRDGGGIAASGFREGAISMTRVEPEFYEGSVGMSLSVVAEKGLVSFEFPAAMGKIPLLAVRNPSGGIETLVGLSWPCNSKDFHLEGSEIICDLCFSRWDVETLTGVSGDCMKYPLQRVTHTIENGILVIRQADIPRMMRLRLAQRLETPAGMRGPLHGDGNGKEDLWEQ